MVDTGSLVRDNKSDTLYQPSISGVFYQQCLLGPPRRPEGLQAATVLPVLEMLRGSA